jgi:hypothetical protein
MQKVEITVEQITINSLTAQIEADAIDLMPEFQRQGNLWDNRRMSQVIESIHIRLPLPAMYSRVYKRCQAPPPNYFYFFSHSISLRSEFGD